jgi:hypothetical protein
MQGEATTGATQEAGKQRGAGGVHIQAKRDDMNEDGGGVDDDCLAIEVGGTKEKMVAHIEEMVKGHDHGARVPTQMNHLVLIQHDQIGNNRDR